MQDLQELSNVASAEASLPSGCWILALSPQPALGESGASTTTGRLETKTPTAAIRRGCGRLCTHFPGHWRDGGAPGTIGLFVGRVRPFVL